MEKVRLANSGAFIKRMWANYSVGIIFIIIVIASIAIKGADFISPNNIINILRNNSVIGIIALGITFVIISGGLDLSVGSQLVVVGSIMVMMLESPLKTTMPVPLLILVVLLVGIVVGTAVGALNGLIIAKGKVPPFIATLGTMNIFRALAQHYMRGGGVMTGNQSYIKIANYELFGFIPMSVVFWILLILLVYVISKYARIGRYMYAVGSNEKATKLSGINVDKVKIIMYAFCGLMVSLATVMETARMGSINPASSGNFYNMDAISSAVVGGARMGGGKGSIIGTFFGVLTIGLINNMMTLVGVPPFLVNATKGVIIILAVLMQKKESD